MVIDHELLTVMKGSVFIFCGTALRMRTPENNLLPHDVIL